MAVAGSPPMGGALPERFEGAAIDSRQVRRGELFVALRGEQTDGHRFIPNAVRAGAAAILCARPDDEVLASGVPQVVVADPLATLHELAHRHLLGHPHIKVVAIAGSNGKTSVKEATAALLAHLAPTLKTQGNLNTETGLPISLLRLEAEHQFAVLEMGAQRVGEVALLCRIAPPDLAVVTVVGPEHLEFFGGMAQVIQAEGEVVEALTTDGIAILNSDDPYVRAMRERTAGRVISYGHGQDAQVRASDVSGDPLMGLEFTLHYEDETARVRLRLPGEHAVTTALAAAAAATACGMGLDAVTAGLGELHPAKRRGEIKRGINGSTVVDDSYNSNRQSALAAVALLQGAKLAAGGKRWLLFGDMLELGTFAAEEHAAVGTAAARGIDELVLVGTEVRATAEAARQAGMPAERIHLYEARLTDAEALAQARRTAAAYVRERIAEGDVALVKGSLGVGMDAMVAELVEQTGGADHGS
jgi:UDP-N-acetylmuramoyl-tripeptide--D-alanyl-D-alanine ligase